MQSKTPYVLITGCNSDIGSSIAKDLAKDENLILAGRNLVELKQLKKSLLNSSNHIIWEIDLTVSDIPKRLLDFLKSNNANISSFIHVAGLFKLFPVRLTKKNDLDNMFKVNVLSAIQIVSVLAKKEFKIALKNIIFISSISALRGKAGYSVYSSSKAALIGLAKSLAVEMQKHTAVNTLVLGAINTKATVHIMKPQEDTLNAHIPLGIGKTDSITKWVSFLIKNHDTWVTGQEIVIDGGATAL